MSDYENDYEDECDSNPNTGSQNDNSIPSGIVKSTAAPRYGKWLSTRAVIHLAFVFNHLHMYFIYLAHDLVIKCR